MDHRLPKAPSRLDDRIAIWGEFKEIGDKYNCLSFGEGSPSMNPPQFVKDALF